MLGYSWITDSIPKSGKVGGRSVLAEGPDIIDFRLLDRQGKPGDSFRSTGFRTSVQGLGNKTSLRYLNSCGPL